MARERAERERGADVLRSFFARLLTPMNTFFVTITQRSGLSEEQMEFCEHWFEQLSLKVIVSREQHSSGDWHLHAVCEDKNKKACGLKRKIIRALDPPVDFSSKNALDVRCVKSGEESRTAGYVAKDGKILVARGWDIKSLLLERAELLKRDLDKNPKATYMLNEKNVEEKILEFAHLHSLPLTCKEEFIKVMCQMAVEGFSVARIKPMIVYAQVMARAGSPEYMRDWWIMKLGCQM